MIVFSQPMNDSGPSRTQVHVPRKRDRSPKSQATVEEVYHHDYAAMAEADIENQLDSGSSPRRRARWRSFWRSPE